MQEQRKYSQATKDRDHVGQLQVEFAYLHEIIPGTSRWPRFRRWWKKLFLASSINHRTAEYFRSSHALELERKRNLKKYSRMIHPFSKARLYWEITMMIPLMFSMITESWFSSWTTIYIRHQFLNPVLLVVDLFAVFDIIFNFMTGTCKSVTKDIVLRPKFVAWLYVKGLFIVDVAYTLPFFHILKQLNSFVPQVPLYQDTKAITVLKNLRIFRFLAYYDNIVEAFNVSYFKARSMRLLFIVLMLTHIAGSYYHYFAVYIPVFTNSAVLPQYWLGWLNQQYLSDYPGEYVRSLFRVVSTVSGTCMAFANESQIEQTMSLFLLVVGQILYYFVIANAMHLLQYYRGASSKYEERSTQLAQFLRSKNLPPELTKRALDFYDFRYYKSYYNESEIMGIVSDRLRQDIITHDCKTLVERVPFIKTLRQAPKLSIVMCMRKQFYQASDVIIKLRDSGDSMYFIKTGTVAVYSSLDKEICHLEDGDHFGEISLLLKEVRVATVVALEDCELYCLEREDFLDALDPYPDALDELVRVAKDRLKQAKDKV